MAKKWIDEQSGCNMIDADTVYEYLWMIWAVGCDYDGCNTVESMKGLVDELVNYANKACDCLLAGRLFPAHDEPKLVNTPGKCEMQTMYEKIKENIESTWPDWKIELANASMADILIRGMEMPKEGFVEILVRDDGTVQQTGQSYRIDGTDYYTPYVGEMPAIYKAIPVPPHGRLIDADVLKEKHHWTDDYYETEYVEVEDIDAAPTIIPASE